MGSEAPKRVSADILTLPKIEIIRVHLYIATSISLILFSKSICKPRHKILTNLKMSCSQSIPRASIINITYVD